MEVVIADDERDPGVTKRLQLCLFQMLGGLEFEVSDLEAGFSGLGENLDFGGDVAGKLAVVGSTAAGGNGSDGSIVRQELLQLRHRQNGLIQIVEPKFEEGIFLGDCGGFFEHLSRSIAGDGDTDLADA